LLISIWISKVFIFHDRITTLRWQSNGTLWLTIDSPQTHNCLDPEPSTSHNIKGPQSAERCIFSFG